MGPRCFFILAINQNLLGRKVIPLINSNTYVHIWAKPCYLSTSTALLDALNQQPAMLWRAKGGAVVHCHSVDGQEPEQ